MKRILRNAVLLLTLVSLAHCGREESVKGKDGINGINGRDGKNGRDGRNGVDGRDGQNGKDGSRIFSGQGSPEHNLGNIGDFYLDTSTLHLYGPKTTEGWGNPITLKGRDGRDGQNGNDGRNGQDGQNGRDGQDGTNGQDGRNGNNGRDGSRIHSGITPPSPTLGNEGDWYIDVFHRVLYGPKTGNSWGEGIPLGCTYD